MLRLRRKMASTRVRLSDANRAPLCHIGENMHDDDEIYIRRSKVCIQYCRSSLSLLLLRSNACAWHLDYEIPFSLRDSLPPCNQFSCECTRMFELLLFV